MNLALEHELGLVVLSACETASGKRLKGEGVISLSRALIQSGCQTVISSLWEVSDQEGGINKKIPKELTISPPAIIFQ